MFSIQMASTGPSKIIQKRCAAVSCAQLRKMVARMPSVHSCETASNSPYSRPSGTDLGLSAGWFTLTCSVGVPFSTACSAMSESAAARTR